MNAREKAIDDRAARRARFLARQGRALAASTPTPAPEPPHPAVDRMLAQLAATRAKGVKVAAAKQERLLAKAPPRWKMAKRVWDSVKFGTLRHHYKTSNGAVIKSRKEYKRIRREIDAAKE
jgi:hypothetical protein